MTPQSRLIINLLLPLLLFAGSYLLFYLLGSGLVEDTTLQLIALVLAALISTLPPLAFRFLIRSQIKEGFALLNNGKVVIPGEIGITDVLGDRITAWKLFKQYLNTEVCLQGENELVYVKLGLEFTIPASQRGKDFVKHYNTQMTFFEAWVQRTIFLASAMDTEIAHSLARNTLMNEEDESVLRSKFLSALEMHPLESVELPVDTSGIHVNRQVRVRKKTVTPAISPALAEEQLLEDDLSLDIELLKQLGINEPG